MCPVAKPVKKDIFDHSGEIILLQSVQDHVLADSYLSSMRTSVEEKYECVCVCVCLCDGYGVPTANVCLGLITDL